MEYVSVSKFAERLGISERTVRNWCAAGKIEGAFLVGKTWNIPQDAAVPGYLRDTCLTAQDNYSAMLDYFKIKH